MSDDSMIRDLWPDWQLMEPLDSGAFGTVYRARHRGHPELYSAVKIIEIPQDPELIASLREEGRTEEQIRHLLEKTAEEYSKEIRRMDLMKGTSHIVSIEDTRTICHEKEPGYTVCIRMELLKTLKEYMADKHLDEKEIIRMGMDLCEALELCHRNGILHLDIKPDNIFVNDRMRSGILYKLGDFGVSEELLKTQDESILQGTLLYIAPEVSRREKADERADLYSLGLTLYRLANGNLLPFVQKKQFPNHDELADAARMRLSGLPLPTPTGVSPAFGAVILKACAFSPEDRYQSATEMLEALRGLLLSGQETAAEPQRRRSGRGRMILITALLALGCVIAAWQIGLHQRKETTEKPEVTKVPMIVVVDRGEAGP